MERITPMRIDCADHPRQPPTPSALLIAGISPRRTVDDSYRGFLDSVAKLISATIMRVMADNAWRSGKSSMSFPR